MHKTFTLIALLTAAVFSYAGIDDYYTFNARTDTYAPITGTVFWDVVGDDYLAGPLQLGFTFPYGPLNFTAVQLCSNGWINIGTNLDTYEYDGNLASADICPVIAPLWDDTDLSDGTAQYLLSGNAPNRVFTVQYSGMHWDYGASNSFDYQVRLHESGKIELIYGPANGTPEYPSATIGINMLPGGSGWFYSIMPGNPPTVSSTVSFDNVTQFPGQGTVYEFLPVSGYPNDLAATAVTGNIIPIAGNQNQYEITVRNRGTSPQNAYQVKLYRAGGIEIGSVAGTAIQPQHNQTFSIPWTPTVAGPETLYGRVVLSGDQNPANDQSPNLSVTVQPAGLQGVTIGAGNELARVPMDFYYRNSLFECLYFPSELVFTDAHITAVEFYNDFESSYVDGSTRIWLGTTTQSSLAGGWIPATQLTQVYDGDVLYPGGSNAVYIQLNDSFHYTGDNLVLMVERPLDVNYYESGDDFQAQTVGIDRALAYFDDSVDADPLNPPAAFNLSGQFPKTKIYYTPGSPTDDPASILPVTGIRSVAPNPFAANASIGFSMGKAGHAALKIYNLKGQLVRVIVDGVLTPGDHTALWDGKDGAGRQVASGIYLCALASPGSMDTRRIMLLK